MITCMKMKSFILKYASKIMFYDLNITCYQLPLTPICDQNEVIKPINHQENEEHEEDVQAAISSNLRCQISISKAP